MIYQKLENNTVKIERDDYVDCIEMGNTIEIRYPHLGGSAPVTLKISKDKYCDRRTGEIKTFQHKSPVRSQSPESLRKTFRKIRQLISTNVTDVDHVKFVTLTYRENVQDTQKLYNDFRVFNQHFCRYCVSDNIGRPKYIAVAEPQGRGAWHLHVFYIWKYKVPYIPHEIFEGYWPHGFLNIKKLKHLENIAGYMNAYLTDLSVSKSRADYCARNKKQIHTVASRCLKKYYLKGGRLSLYPAGFNILRHSKGIRKPQKTVMEYDAALDRTIAAGMTLKYESCYQIEREDGEFRMRFKKEEYRK